MLDQLLIVLAVTGLVMVTPGPDMVLVLRNTLMCGRSAGLQTSLGILSGNLVHITYCVLGIGWVISRSIVAYSTLKYAGAAYLIYVGIMSFRSSRSLVDTDERNVRKSRRVWFVQGFVNNLLNPKGTLFYLGVFTTVITPETSPGTMLLLVMSMMTVSAFFWVVFVYTLDREAIRQFVRRSQQTVNRIYGGLLIILGVRVALTER